MHYFKTKSVVWMLPLQLNNSFEYSGNTVVICLNISLCQFSFDLKKFLGFSCQGEIKLEIMKAIFCFHLTIF